MSEKTDNLEKAKRNYPVGTKARCLYSNRIGVIKLEDHFIPKYYVGYSIWATNTKGLRTELYDSTTDTWAEIIKD